MSISIRGPRGLKGISGEQGPQGPQGLQGPQGPQGPLGPNSAISIFNNPPTAQGSYASWNAGCAGGPIPGGCNGATQFINQQGGGSGGFQFINYNGDGTFKNQEMNTDGSGNLNVSNDINAGGNISIPTNKAITIRDQWHGLKWSEDVDGPKLHGHSGGKLSTKDYDILKWSNDGVNIFSGLNILRKNGQNTHFNWHGDGKNYIRGNTDVDGNTNINGNLTTSKINFTSKWSGSPDGVTDVSEISNDTTDYKKLMIIGNRSGGTGLRRTGIWDQLDVHGNLNTYGDVTSNSIGRNGDSDWFRIFGTKNNGTALYNGLAIGSDGGRGLAVGDWSTNVPAGDIKATGNIKANNDIQAYGNLFGKGVYSNNVTVGDKLNITPDVISHPGRMHITAEERLYLLPKGGIDITKDWGASGDVRIGGNVGVGGSLTVNNNYVRPIKRYDGNNGTVSGHEYCRGGWEGSGGDKNQACVATWVHGVGSRSCDNVPGRAQLTYCMEL